MAAGVPPLKPRRPWHPDGGGPCRPGVVGGPRRRAPGGEQGARVRRHGYGTTRSDDARRLAELAHRRARRRRCSRWSSTAPSARRLSTAHWRRKSSGTRGHADGARAAPERRLRSARATLARLPPARASGARAAPERAPNGRRAATARGGREERVQRARGAALERRCRNSFPVEAGATPQGAACPAMCAPSSGPDSSTRPARPACRGRRRVRRGHDRVVRVVGTSTPLEGNAMGTQLAEPIPSVAAAAAPVTAARPKSGPVRRRGLIA